MFMLDMKNRFTLKPDLLRVVEEASEERITSTIKASEAIAITELGRRDIFLHGGKFYLSVLDTSENVGEVRMRHEESVRTKKDQDMQRKLFRECLFDFGLF